MAASIVSPAALMPLLPLLPPLLYARYVSEGHGEVWLPSTPPTQPSRQAPNVIRGGRERTENKHFLAPQHLLPLPVPTPNKRYPHRLSHLRHCVDRRPPVPYLAAHSAHVSSRCAISMVAYAAYGVAQQTYGSQPAHGIWRGLSLAHTWA